MYSLFSKIRILLWQGSVLYGPPLARSFFAIPARLSSVSTKDFLPSSSITREPYSVIALGTGVVREALLGSWLFALPDHQGIWTSGLEFR